MSATIAVGDILEVKCKSGSGYVSYAGRHSRLGDAIWIVPVVLEQPPSTGWSDLFSRPGYFAFYPAHSALRQRLIRKVGYAIEALHPIPESVRNPINTRSDGSVSSWTISQGGTRVPRKDADLSDPELRLPIASVWNHKLLCERLESGWRPIRGSDI